MSRLFGKPSHTAFVVPDIDREIERVLAAGLGPIFIMRRLKLPGGYRGSKQAPVVTSAFFATGNVHFELVQPHDDTPSSFAEFLKKNPAGGMHHIAYYSEDFEADIKRAKEAGLELRVVQDNYIHEGEPFEIYAEAVNAPNPLFIQLMAPEHSAPMFAHFEAVAADWDGSDPVRDMYELLPPGITLPRG